MRLVSTGQHVEADPGERAELARLQREFPGYRIWRSVRRDGRPGDWVATLHDPAAGVDPTVIRGDADTLRKALRREAEQADDRLEIW